MVLVQPVPIDKVPHANNPLTLSTGNGRHGGSDSLPMISLEADRKSLTGLRHLVPART